MRLGYIQKIIVSHIRSCGDRGCYFEGPATQKAPEFFGFDYVQVERAVIALEKRKILRRNGPIYRIEEANVSSR